MDTFPLDALPSREVSPRLVPTQGLPLTLSIFALANDDEVELIEAQPYTLEDQLDLPPSCENEESNCACT